MWRAKRVWIVLVATAVAMAATAATAQTDQRPGSDGDFGKTVQVGVKAPLYFTLKSMEYRADRVMVDDYLWAPSEDDKLVVLHYSIQNPTKKAVSYDGLCPIFELYDAENNAYATVDVPRGIGVGLEDTHKRPRLQLQPAQTILLYVGFRLPAKAAATKLVVTSTVVGEPVVRYKLDGKVNPFKAPYADPADATGATLRTDIPAKVGDVCPLLWADFTLVAGPQGQAGPPVPGPKGTHWAVYTASLRNISTKPHTLNAAGLPALLTLAGGGEAKLAMLYQADAWQTLNQEIRPKAEQRCRLVFAVPDGVEATALRLRLAGVDNNTKRFTHTFVHELAAKPAEKP